MTLDVLSDQVTKLPLMLPVTTTPCAVVIAPSCASFLLSQSRSRRTNVIFLISWGDRFGHIHRVPLSSAATMYAPASRESEADPEDADKDSMFCDCVGVVIPSEMISDLASDCNSSSFFPAAKL